MIDLIKDDHWKVSGRQINVSVEVWNFEPVSLETITALIQDGPKTHITDSSYG